MSTDYNSWGELQFKQGQIDFWGWEDCWGCGHIWFFKSIEALETPQVIKVLIPFNILTILLTDSPTPRDAIASKNVTKHMTLDSRHFQNTIFKTVHYKVILLHLFWENKFLVLCGTLNFLWYINDFSINLKN